MLKLDNRLSLCGQLVENDAVLLDIGTDHAYLPVSLIQQGKIKKALACDIGAEPLLSGIATIKKYHAESLVQTRLSDGFKAVNKDEFTDCVIAGMGAEVIIDIISSCDYLRGSNIHLILQPMTRYYLLVEYLMNNGFTIDEQRCCTSKNKHYTVMSVYCKKDKEINSDCDKSVYYLGKINPADRESRLFLLQEIDRLKKRAIGDNSLTDVIDYLREITDESC